MGRVLTELVELRGVGPISAKCDACGRYVLAGVTAAQGARQVGLCCGRGPVASLLRKEINAVGRRWAAS